MIEKIKEEILNITAYKIGCYWKEIGELKNWLFIFPKGSYGYEFRILRIRWLEFKIALLEELLV